MSSIGNDNYKPEMVPPKPMKKKSGWLSSNMAQLMVFLNGLILTVTAYATLSVFIQEVVKDDFVETTNEIQEYISSSYQNIEETLIMFHAFFDVIPKDKENMLVQYAKAEFAGLDDFEEIYWVHNREGRRVLKRILNNPNFDEQWARAFVSYNSNTDRQEKFYLVDDAILPKGKSGLFDNIFAVAQNSRVNPDSFLVGVIDSKKIFSHDWLLKRESIYSVDLTNNKHGASVFSYLYDDNEGLAAKGKFYTSISKVPFINEAYDLKVDLIIGGREFFLQKIPLLMLLFGVTLTLIGTLYVRNNQTQSRKLSSMNRKLAQKNYALSQEMTERERLNQMIQTSAQENKAIINAVSDIIFEVTMDGTIAFLNNAWKKVTGFELDRTMGCNIFDLIHAGDKEEQKFGFDQLVKGHVKTYRAFTRIRCSNGSYRTVEMAISMLRRDDNKDLRAVGSITDVEERRRAERALGEAEKKYRMIVENAASGIYQVTPEGQFLSANPAFAKIAGYGSAEEILRDINKAQEQLYSSSEARDKILKDIDILKMPKSYEVQIKRKDNQMVWVKENIRPVYDDEGMLLFYEGSMEDIDVRKKAEIALKEAITKSDLANRAKSEFLANMSHELRTPLNSIIGFAEIIKDEAFGKIEKPEYKNYADNIFSSGSRLLNVINEILDVSQIETGNRDLKEGLISLSDVTASCLDMMRGKAQAKTIRIDNKVDASVPNVIGEKHAVKQMLLNLLSNAISYSPDNSYIMVDAEVDGENRLRLSVTDTGVGLTEQELEKAISPFGQIDSDHARSQSGTGLGLTLVKSLVELHGGELELVSQKNIGTTATVIFPEKRVAEAQKKNTKNAKAEENQKV